MPQPDVGDAHVDSLLTGLGVRTMPYDTLAALPSTVKKLPENKQKQWMAVWNSAHTSCMKEKGDAKACEQSAFAQAWGVVNKSFEEEDHIIFVPSWTHYFAETLEKMDIASVSATAALTGYVELVEKATASINDLPDSAFAYIEPGGEKDETGKTTPRSLRHFPIHDEAHVRNALARLNQSPFGDKAKAKVLAAAHRMGIKLDPERWKKSADEKLELVIKILNKEAPQGLYYGIVYEPNVVDSHGDFTSADEIEKAAHDFLPNAVINLHHSEDLQDVQVVESYIAPASFTVGEQTIQKGSWVLVTRVLNDELRQAISRGEITGYSLEGSAVRMESLY